MCAWLHADISCMYYEMIAGEDVSCHIGLYLFVIIVMSFTDRSSKWLLGNTSKMQHQMQSLEMFQLCS